jgi:hypothetical protein
MWHMPTPKPETEFEVAQRKSQRPIAAPSVMGVTTTKGSASFYVKPRGTYSAVNPDAVAENRRRQVDRFLEVAEEIESQSHSGVRAKVSIEGNHAQHRTARRT